jgi:hypothetical protein
MRCLLVWCFHVLYIVKGYFLTQETPTRGHREESGMSYLPSCPDIILPRIRDLLSKAWFFVLTSLDSDLPLPPLELFPVGDVNHLRVENDIKELCFSRCKATSCTITVEQRLIV